MTSPDILEVMRHEWAQIEKTEFWRVYMAAIAKHRNGWSKLCESKGTELDDIRWWQGMVGAADIFSRLPDKILNPVKVEVK